jgi:hypothetical protein
VEEETSTADYQVADKRDEKDIVVAVAQAVRYAFVCEIDEHEVGECIDDLCQVNGCIVILRYGGVSILVGLTC